MRRGIAVAASKKERKYMTKKKNLCWAILLTLLFLVFTLLICTVDVHPIGPEGTKVGFAGLNEKAHTLFGENMTLYRITDLLGYVAITVAAFFGVVGLCQWIRRKNILKVDRNILALGVLFLIVIGLYFFFSKVAVNYRPVILPDETAPEASFPSSHTMLALTVFGGTLIILREKVTERVLRVMLTVLALILIAVTVIGRLLSGAHWLTDILAGILLTVALLSWFNLGRKEKTD